MASLTNTKIKDTYPGLIKIEDNGAVQPTALKTLTDGTGGTLPIQVSQVETKFTSGSLVDFTGATVTGDNDTTYVLNSTQDGSNADIKLTDPLGNDSKVTLVAGTNITLTNLGNDLTISAAGGGGGSAGLESGTGTDSMQSASSLTTVAANASAADTIALGDGAIASSANNIAIGNTANGGGDDAFARGNIAIGFNTDATNEKDVAIGNEAQATGSRSVAIGDGANASGSRSVVVGASSTATAFSSAVFGAFSTASAEGAT